MGFAVSEPVGNGFAGTLFRTNPDILMQNDPIDLVDGFGRRHHRLRISVTDRCNLRCTYCMPAEGAEFVPRSTLLTFEEITSVTELLVRRTGLDGVRLTGGEPLVRRDLPRLVAMLSAIEGLDRLSMTTNGILLPAVASELREAGLRGVNISIDSLDRQRFEQLTRRDHLDQTLAGIHAAIAAGLRVKLNALAIAGVTEHEAVDLVRFAIDRGVPMRFIEFMPLDADGRWMAGSVLSGDDLLDGLRQAFDRVVATGRPEPSSPSETFEVTDRPRQHGQPGRSTTVGIIRSVTRPFCGACNRLRLTADGAMRNCLFSTTETPLRDLLRGGAPEEEILRRVVECVAGKAAAHGGEGGDAGFAQTPRAMYSIGG